MRNGCAEGRAPTVMPTPEDRLSAEPTGPPGDIPASVSGRATRRISGLLLKPDGYAVLFPLTVCDRTWTRGWATAVRAVEISGANEFPGSRVGKAVGT